VEKARSEMTRPATITSPSNRPNPTQRFSNRVENYIRFRPRYPKKIISLLQEKCGLTKDSVVADIGSGTGFLSEMFLENGNRVFGVEPNREMREAGERLLKKRPQFTSVEGTAEATTLPDKSVDLVVAGQAFHWFDRVRCRKEFARILKSQKWVVLIWNDRHTDRTPFLADYEHLLHTYATDYKEVNHKRIDAALLQEFFGAKPNSATFPNFQHFDFAGLKGRLLSSSYAPEAGQPKHEEMLVALRKLFDTHQRNGQITFEYDTAVYYGRLTGQK
jgi:SAM-dependent methyltransferase